MFLSIPGGRFTSTPLSCEYVCPRADMLPSTGTRCSMTDSRGQLSSGWDTERVFRRLGHAVGVVMIAVLACWLGLRKLIVGLKCHSV